MPVRGMLAVAIVAALMAAAVGRVNGSDGAKPPRLEFLGEAIVPPGTTFAGTTVGGLSSIAYDAARGVFYSLSDDQGQFNAAPVHAVPPVRARLTGSAPGHGGQDENRGSRLGILISPLDRQRFLGEVARNAPR
jgi:hypothetical protein